MISTGPERDATIVPAGTLLAGGYSQQPKIYTNAHLRASPEQSRRTSWEEERTARNRVVSVWDALGLVLAQEVQADREYPPFDRIDARWYAVAFEEPRRAQRSVWENQSRDTVREATGPGTCLHHDGAAVPAGADAVG